MVVSNKFLLRLNSLTRYNGQDKEFVNFNLYRLILKEEVLMAAYEKIKSNKTALTSVTGDETLDGFGLERINRLKMKLTNESWQPRPARKIQIPKTGTNKTSLLGIQEPEEKIVQTAMLFILNAIYEPRFLPTSFGFRPGKGVHDALQEVDWKFFGTNLIIEGNITGMYDNIDHHILIRMLEKNIQDARFIRLVWKMLRTGYMNIEEKSGIIKPLVGIPRGSIISPILSNIYLHELDVFMQDKCSNMSSVKQRVRTPPYRELNNKLRRLKSQIKPSLPIIDRKRILKEIRQLHIRSLNTRNSVDPRIRINYIRYADDFIIGIAGPNKLAEEIKEEVAELFNTLNLTLNDAKTKITDIKKERVIFLGYQIQISTSIKKKYVYPQGQRPTLKRVTGKGISLQAPIDLIIERLYQKGFCNKKGFPQPKKIWIPQEDNQIIQHYNSIIRGIFNYYLGANKRSRLGRIWYILKFSCAFTLAARHRTSLKKIFTKHGSSLTVIYGMKGEKVIKLYKPGLKEKDKKWLVERQLPDSYRYIARRLS